MSIATELTNLNDYILDAYTAVQGKGGTVPANKNMANLDTAINSIPGPNPYAIDRKLESGALTIPHKDSLSFPSNVTEIKSYANAYAYAGYYTSDTQLTANVDLGSITRIYTGGLLHYTHYADTYTSLSYNTPLATSSTFNASALTAVDSRAFECAFMGHNFGSVSFPALTTLNTKAFYMAFPGQKYSGGTSFSFPSLTTVSSPNAFDSCFAMSVNGKVTTCGPSAVSFHALTTVSGTESFMSAFSGCGKLTSANVDFSALTTVSGANTFKYAFRRSGIDAVPFTALTNVSGSTPFQEAFTMSSVTTASFPALTNISGSSTFSQAFSGCADLTSVSFPVLEEIAASNAFNFAFNACTSLTSVSFPTLARVNASSPFSGAFTGCTSLASVSFPELAEVKGSWAFSRTFSGCTALTSISFPSITVDSFGSYSNQFQDMLQSCSGVTVHFPASAQTKIQILSGYPNFGGTNTTVLFDL